MSVKPHYLFLQGPIGPFFRELAERLDASGKSVHAIHFNGGDALWWRLSRAKKRSFRGRADARWRHFFEDCAKRWAITDVLLFGDCRPVHREAIKVCERLGLRIHVFEEGYLRPDWITLEQGGVNANSRLPRDPDWYRAVAKNLRSKDAVAKSVSRNFVRRAVEHGLHVGGTAAMSFTYPLYRTHRPWPPLQEYASGAARAVGRPRRKKEADRICQQIFNRQQAYYLFPLQLDADAQIRFHSNFNGMAAAAEQVIASFARFAPDHTRLVITEHPLDQGVINFEKVVSSVAKQFKVGHRVDFVPEGSPQELIAKSRAVITVNSTLGQVALELGKPVKVLAQAVYALPGLVFQGSLDEFWPKPSAPDASLYDDFRRVVMELTQINGGYYWPEARQMAVEGTARRLERPLPLTRSLHNRQYATPASRLSLSNATLIAPSA